MASIERTAYPRLKPPLTANELHALYCPTDEERQFISTHARGDTQQLTLLTVLKCQQHLGYLPALADVPEHIRTYLCQQLHLLPLMYAHVETEKTLYRYRQLIRTFLDIKPYGDGGKDVVETAVQQAAYTMSDPADLINLAVEHLVQQRFELPAFSTLDRLVIHVRHGVYQDIYTRIPTRPFLTEVANTKVQQFAAEAAALDVGDMRDIHTPSRRYSLLICFLYQAQVQTRDALVEMLLKRMRRTTTSAKKQLKKLQDQHRELEEQMLAVFADVIDETIQTPPEENTALGQGLRTFSRTMVARKPSGKATSRSPPTTTVQHWVGLSRHFGPPPLALIRNSPMLFCATFSPSLAMPVNSAHPKPRVVPMDRLAARP